MNFTEEMLVIGAFQYVKNNACIQVYNSITVSKYIAKLYQLVCYRKGA